MWTFLCWEWTCLPDNAMYLTWLCNLFNNARSHIQNDPKGLLGPFNSIHPFDLYNSYSGPYKLEIQFKIRRYEYKCFQGSFIFVPWIQTQIENNQIKAINFVPLSSLGGIARVQIQVQIQMQVHIQIQKMIQMQVHVVGSYKCRPFNEPFYNTNTNTDTNTNDQTKKLISFHVEATAGSH